MTARVLTSYLTGGPTCPQVGITVGQVGNLTLSNWVVGLLSRGVKPATVRRYLGTLHTQAKAWSGYNVALAETFSSLATKLVTVRTDGLAVTQENLDKLPQLIARANQRHDTIDTLLLLLLYNPSLTLQEAIDLTVEEAKQSSVDQIAQLADCQPRHPNAHYLLPLQQGRQRPAAIQRQATSDLAQRVRDAGLQLGSSFSRHDITALWIAQALSQGIAPAIILGIINNAPAPYSYLNLLPAQEITPDTSNAVIQQVADSLSDPNLHWYVMHLRAGKTPDDITRQLQTDAPRILSELTYYYPTRRMLRTDTRRRQYIDAPYLPNILFFRTHRDNVAPLFRHIGAHAWCYRATASPASPYTIIPDKEMRQFQRHIGLLTPDIELQLIDDQPIAAVGDTLDIVGGDLYRGQQGQVLKVTHQGNHTIYTLQLTATTAIRWAPITIDATLTAVKSEELRIKN